MNVNYRHISTYKIRETRNNLTSRRADANQQGKQNTKHSGSRQTRQTTHTSTPTSLNKFGQSTERGAKPSPFMDYSVITGALTTTSSPYRVSHYHQTARTELIEQNRGRCHWKT